MNELNSEQELARLISDIILEREKRGISQAELGNLTGLKQSAISRMENLSVPPQLDTLLKVVNALGLSLTIQNNNTLKENKDMKISNEKIVQLRTDLYFCSVTLSYSEDNYFHLISEKEEEFFFTEEGDILVLNQKKRKFFERLFNWVLIKAELKIPANFKGDVVFFNKDGRAIFKGVTVNNLNVQNRNGKVVFEDIKANNITGLIGNGRTELTNIEIAHLNITSKNGRVSICNTKAGFIKIQNTNGRILVDNVDAAAIDAVTFNGSILAESLKADEIKLSTKNGRIAASIEDNESEYSMDIKVVNGKSVVGGKKNSGNFIYKDKSKSKHISANSLNGNITVVFCDTDKVGVNAFKEELNSASNEIDEFSENEP